MSYSHSCVFYVCQYLELRFGKSIRNLMTAFFLLNMLMFLPIASFLPAIAFAQVTGLNIHMINALVIVVCVSYTMLVREISRVFT